MEQIEKLREIVNGSSNIVFFGGAGFPRRAASRISEAWTDYITRLMTIPRKRF